MKTGNKLPAAILLLATPLAAFAEGTPHIVLFAFGGGAAGGFLGALFACWLCKRIRGSKDQTDTKKY